jgi:hypothetical protein
MQTFRVDAPDGVHPVVDQHDRDLFDVAVEQHRVVEDRFLLERRRRESGEHVGHDGPCVVAQMAARLAEQHDVGHALHSTGS